MTPHLQAHETRNGVSSVSTKDFISVALQLPLGLSDSAAQPGHKRWDLTRWYERKKERRKGRRKKILMEKEKTVCFPCHSDSDLWGHWNWGSNGREINGFCVVAALNLSLKSCCNISLLRAHFGSFMSELFWSAFKRLLSLFSQFFSWAVVCSVLGKAMVLQSVLEDNVLSKSTVVKELVLWILVYALLLLTHFSISCEKEHQKTNEKLGTAQNIFIKKTYAIANPFSPIFGKSILITFLFIKRKSPKGWSALIVSKASFNFWRRNSFKIPDQQFSNEV